jgi:hypothetical protein
MLLYLQSPQEACDGFSFWAMSRLHRKNLALLDFDGIRSMETLPQRAFGVLNGAHRPDAERRTRARTRSLCSGLDGREVPRELHNSLRYIHCSLAVSNVNSAISMLTTPAL